MRDNYDHQALLAALRAPEDLSRFTLRDWDRFIPVARQAGLLARLASLLAERGGLECVPDAPRAHLEAARILAEKQRRDTLYEVDQLTAVLGKLVMPLVLLKGAAYLCAGLPPATGRVFNDIDILVPRAALNAVEAVLGLAGWRLGEMDPYDEQYYRCWMHQLPPLIHVVRQSAIDVHHTIVPMTARIALDADALLARTVEIAGYPGLATLAPADMVLHSATHLFNEGEFGRGLRDLDDLNQLLRHFGRDAGFWDEVVSRAAQLDLARPLFYALRYSGRLLATPVPERVTGALHRVAPASPVLALMDALFDRGLRSSHHSCRAPFSRPALWLLYVRAHYLRMPIHLLLPHLIRKALHRKPVQAAFAQ